MNLGHVRSHYDSRFEAKFCCTAVINEHLGTASEFTSFLLTLHVQMCSQCLFFQCSEKHLGPAREFTPFPSMAQVQICSGCSFHYSNLRATSDPPVNLWLVCPNRKPRWQQQARHRSRITKQQQRNKTKHQSKNQAAQQANKN